MPKRILIVDDEPRYLRLLEANLHVLERLLAEASGARVLAVGRTAQAALATLGVDAPALRHPAHGGASLFRSQLADQLRAKI